MMTTLCRKAILAAVGSAFLAAAACDMAKPDTLAAAKPAADSAPSLAAPPAGAIPETDPAKATERRIADIISINTAIQAYHAKNGRYPDGSKGLRGVVELGADWIPGLAPEFMPALPRDPLYATDNQGPQYLYVSSPAGYKIIAVSGNAGHCGPDVERDGIKIDPARINDQGCWAYGFWTEDLKAF